ncbi:hypothetical protein BRC97_06940 [Halobacteriales archaeon QS_6_71_20]|nr:MAG: hypothetical protein BRC97_06940 [Halobacteriales archaeon QS_6_71_20]
MSDAPETPKYVADGYVVDHHDPASFIVRCPSCEETDTQSSRPRRSARICSACDRLMGVTPVREQRTGWAARAARGEDVGEPMTDGGTDEDLPGVAYESDHRGGHGGKLHLDQDCDWLATDEPGEVQLAKMPPAFRKWCQVCGPDGEPQRPPQDGGDDCAECGRHVGTPALVDGVCLGCHEPDDEEDRRLVADGGPMRRPETPRVVSCDVERTGVSPDGENHLDPLTISLRVAYRDGSHEARLRVGYRMEGATAQLHNIRGSAGSGKSFNADVHVPAVLKADERVDDLPFVQGVAGLAWHLDRADPRVPDPADPAEDDE